MLARWIAVAVVTIAIGAACGGSSDEDDAANEKPPIVLTATALAAGATPSSDTTTAAEAPTLPPRDPGAPLSAEDATALLEHVLVQPDDIDIPGWVIQSDNTTDADQAVAADPSNAEANQRCGHLLSRTITNFPPDSVAAFFAGTTLAYFSQGTVYATAAGAMDCASEAAALLAEPGALARVFGGVFTNPDRVVVETVDYEAVGDGSFAAKLTGQTNAGGIDIDLTILVVSFRDDAVTYAVGLAVSGIQPPVDELRPLVDLVLRRSQEFQ
jgi:hypothetical protein